MKRYRNNNSMDKPHALTLDMTTAESESLLLRRIQRRYITVMVAVEWNGRMTYVR